MAEINSAFLSGIVDSIEHVEKGDFQFAVVKLLVVSEWNGTKKEQIVPLTAYSNLFADVDVLLAGHRVMVQYKLGARDNKGFLNLTATIVSIVQVLNAKETKKHVPPPIPARQVKSSETDVPF